MKVHMAFRMDGVSHNRETLEEHCRIILSQPGNPEWERELCSFILDFLDSSNTKLKQSTSGTTGRAKTIPLNRASMIGSARKTLSFFDLQPGDRALLCLPIRYIAGKMMVVRALVGGLDLVTVEPSGRPLKEVKGTFSFGAMVPLQVHESLKHGDELSCIGELIVGGGELHPELRKKMAFMERPALYESFAMTETYTHFALKRINGSSPDSLFCLMEGVRASQDERGCLVVEVEGVTGGPVTTNDLVEMDPSGKAFRWLGRLDHVISSGGIKIIPEILEQKISNCLGLECLVLPEPDVSLGSRLLLMVESPDRDPPEKKWLSLLRKDLMDHEIPKRIVTVLHIPRNASYKPDRRAALTLI